VKINWLVGAVFSMALVIPASAQISVYVRSGPPAERYERRGEAPNQGMVWIDGYWATQGRHYSWVAGRWEQPPYQGAYWSHPHYDHERQGWRMHEGHWDHEDHGNRGNDHDDHDRGHDRDHGRDHNKR
jgi:hypothetical protein